MVQETGIKAIPMEKKRQKATWLSGEALQIAVKGREVKSKGEKERYKHLNAEFQRIARRDNKAIFSDQCKEIEENNPEYSLKGLMLKLKLHYFGHLMRKADWLEKTLMLGHSSVLAWKIPGTGEPGGLLSIGSHRGSEK